MDKDKTSLAPGLIVSGLPVSTLNESDLDPVITANLSGSFQNSSHIIVGTDAEGDVHNMSSLSQRSNGSLSFDVKKFTSRLSSHMSTFSDTLFSDIEDIEDIAEPQVAHQETQVENPLLQENTLKEMSKQYANLNEGAIYGLSTSVNLPRTTTPQPAGVTVLHGITEEVTPTKSIQPEIDPLTPTANLKVLISAASPEIRNRERQKLNETGEFDTINTSFMNSCESTSDIIVDDNVEYIDVGSSEKLFGYSKLLNPRPEKVVLCQENKKAGSKLDHIHSSVNNGDWENCPEPLVSVSRKEKSLGLLCQRFLALFPEHPVPTEKPTICLDGIAVQLGVERRRIYDIINVLESVDIVSRVGKNQYEWHGKRALYAMLANLRVKAEIEGFRKRLKEMRDREGLETTKPSKTKNRLNTSQTQEVHRKDKSLGLLCQKFLMLFLVSEEPRVINLDLSAKILIGDPDVDKTETSKYKTKIRRLYDIANILTSLDLICKIHVTEVRGRKPAFKYTGPDPESLDQFSASDAPTSLKENPEIKKKCITVQPSSIQPAKMKQVVQSSQTGRPGRDSKGRGSNARKSLTRHASFEQICQVAEQELERELWQIPVETPKVIGTTGDISQQHKMKSEDLQLSQENSQIITPQRKEKQEPQTTVLNLTENQLQDIIKMLNEQPENTQVCLKTSSSDRSPTLSSKELLNALKKASNQQAKKVVANGHPGTPVVVKNECSSPLISSSSDSGYFSFTSQKPSGETPARVLKRETESVYSPGVVEIKKLKMTGIEQDKFQSENEEVENEEPLDLSRYNILHEPPLAQGPDLEVANIIKESQTNKMSNKLSPLKSLNIGDTFSSNVPLIKTPCFGLPKMPSMEGGLSSPRLIDKVNQPGSQLNTPTFPLISSGGQETGAPSVFQFPTPGRPRVSDGTSIKSQPTTPTYHLSSTNSPVMLLPSRPASFGGLACANEMVIEKQPLTPAVPVLRTHPLSVQKFNNILMTPTSEHLTTTYKISPFTSTPTTPFLLPGSANKVLNNITPVHLRPCGGIRPSMNKMVNLVSIFAPHSDVVEQVPVSVLGNNNLGGNNATVVNELVPSSLDENCTTPVGPHISHLGAGVLTPGTFFSHTPGSELFSPVNLHDSVEFCGTSAFQSLKTVGKTNGSFVPPRKLSLPEENKLI